MLDALNITEEEALGLAEIAQHDLALARDFARRAQAAEDSDEASRLARSYQRAARSYRQTLALKARLRRDLAQTAAPATPQVRVDTHRPDAVTVVRRIGELRTALLRLAWDESERPEDERPDDALEAGERPDTEYGDRDPVAFKVYRQDVEEILADDSLDERFCDEPLDEHVARLASDLALEFPPDAIARWRDLPDPPKALLDPEWDAPAWRSSA